MDSTVMELGVDPNDLVLLDEDLDEPEASVGVEPMRSASTSSTSHGFQQWGNCSICLNRMDDPAILSGCEHAFCFNCIAEWLKMKPQCPLCKNSALRLKHNISIPAFCEAKLTWASVGNSVTISELRASFEMERIHSSTSYPPDVEKHAVVGVITRLRDEINCMRTLCQNGYGRPITYHQAAKALQKEMAAYEELLRQFQVSASRQNLFSQPAFRRVVYLSGYNFPTYFRNLAPRSIVPPSYDIAFSADYVRSNRAGVERQLRDYVLREVGAITQEELHDPDELMENLLDYFAGRTNRMTIVVQLHRIGIRHPHQFLNNLLHFASTGQSLAVYDQDSEFTPRGAHTIAPHIAGSSDDVLIVGDSTGEDVQVVGERRQHAGQYNQNGNPHSSQQRIAERRRDADRSVVITDERRDPAHSIVQLEEEEDHSWDNDGSVICFEDEGDSDVETIH